MAELLESEKRRFSKLMELEGFGYQELIQLKKSKVAIVGLTGIGISALLSVVSSGVGQVKVVDFNTINETMLPQGTFFGKGDIGKLKTIAVKEKLVDLRLVETVSISNVEVRQSNVDTILSGMDIVVYASYSRETMTVISDFCRRNGLPFIWTIGCKETSYLLYTTPEESPGYVSRVIEEVDSCFKCDCYYTSFLSSIAGGAAASMVVNALLGRATTILRKCNVNTLQVEYLQPN